jgi:uncharacterized membrane protein
LRRASALLVLALGVSGCVSTPAADDGFPQALSGLGTEPFWNVEIAGGTVTYASADEPTPRSAPVVRHTAEGVLTMSGTLAGEALHLTVRRQPCSDGMSDRRYPFALDLTLGSRLLHGCAYPTGKQPTVR